MYVLSNDLILISLGKKIKSIREFKSLSQTELAYKIGKDQPSINRLERGKINPSFLYLKEVSEGLEISISEMLIDL